MHSPDAEQCAPKAYSWSFSPSGENLGESDFAPPHSGESGESLGPPVLNGVYFPSAFYSREVYYSVYFPSAFHSREAYYLVYFPSVVYSREV